MKSLLLSLCFSLALATQVDQYIKYFFSKPPDPNGCNVIGKYRDLFVCANSMMHLIDANTGDFVTGINTPVTLADFLVQSNFLLCFAIDGTIEKWDLDTMIRVKYIKPAPTSSETMACKYDAEQDTAYCGLNNGALRKINLITGKTEFEVKSHSQGCFIVISENFVFTSGFDGLVKKFDKRGTLLATYEESLGYAYVLGVDHNYVLVSYYEIETSRKRRLFRWDFETGQKEKIPLEFESVKPLALEITDQNYMFLNSNSRPIQYGIIHKENITVAHIGYFDSPSDPSLKQDRLYWSYKSKFYEAVLRNFEFELVRVLPLDYFAPSFVDPVLLPNGKVLVYCDLSYGDYFFSLLELETGVFTERLTQFDSHVSFRLVDNLLVGAHDNNLVAYALPTFELAWNASAIVSSKIRSIKVSGGIIYVQENDFIRMFNFSSLEFIGGMGMDLSIGKYRDILDGVAFLDRDNAVFSYDIRTGKFLTNYIGPQNVVLAVLAFEENLYVGSYDFIIYKYSLDSSIAITIFQGHTLSVETLLLSAQFLYSGSDDLTVRKWNKDTGEPLFVYGGYLSRPFPFLVKGYNLYTCERNQITVWSLFTNRVAHVYFEKSFLPISLHIDGGILQSGAVDGSLVYWDIENGRITSKPLLGNSANPAFSFKLQNQSYFIPKRDGSILKWNYVASSDPSLIRGLNATKMTAFTVYQDMILLFKKGEGLLKYNTSSELTTKIDITGYFSDFVVVIDDMIYSGNNDSTITKHRITDLKILSSTKAHDSEVTVLAGYGSYLVSGGNDAVLKKWDKDSMNLVLVMRREIENLGHLGGITSIYIVGDILFSGSSDMTARRWDLITGKVQFTYTGHTKQVRCVYFYNSSLFTAGEDGLIQMFTVILPKAVSTSVTRSTALASRINPIVRPENIDESATLSAFELIIMIASVLVALILSIFIFVRIRNLKKEVKTQENSGKVSSFIDTRFVTAVQDQTLVQTSVGLSIPASKEVSETAFIPTHLLGKGGSGSVFYAKALSKSLQKHGDEVVAKVLQGNYSSLSESAKAMFNQEIGIMEMLQFKGGFAEMLGYSLKPCTIIMKLYNRGSLANWIRSNNTRSLRTIMEFCVDIATSMSTMHKLELAHCDLKPDNILIDEDRPGHFKCVITDFGICHVLSESIIDAKSFNHINVRGVSVRYAAPEAFERFRKRTITSTPDEMKSGDVFSFGMILYEMLTTKAPWN